MFYFDFSASSQEPTTTTLLMARDEMKNGLPQGAVEIGTIAETEPGTYSGPSTLNELGSDSQTILR